MLERLDIARVLDAQTQAAEVERAAANAVTALHAGRSPLIYSAAGPDDAAVLHFDEHAAHAAHAGLARADAARRVGEALACVLPRLLDAVPLQRVAVAGGDGAGAVAHAVALDTLTVAAPMAPGAPLCRAGWRMAARDGLEIVLKGGQLGAADFFGRVRGDATIIATHRRGTT